VSGIHPGTWQFEQNSLAGNWYSYQKVRLFST
jgi:hypothetical protein